MIHSTNVLQEKNRSVFIKLRCRMHVLFWFIFNGNYCYFSIIGMASVGVGAYIVLRDDSQKRETKREIEKNGIGNRRLVG